MEINTTEFIDCLQLPKNIATATLKNSDDCIVFLNIFFGNSFNHAVDLMRFREYKIVNTTYSLNDFIHMILDKGLKYACNTIMLEDLTDCDAKALSDLIDGDIVTVNELWDFFRSNPQKSITSFILCNISP